MSANQIAAFLYPALVHKGYHAWGWMAYDPKDNVPTSIQYFKTPGRCDTNQATDKQLAQIPKRPRWFVGHLRYATLGKHSDNVNNHPILHDHIIGVHNGVLHNHREILEKTGRQDDRAVVDSEAIFAAINKWGPVKGLQRIRGAMVSVYADDRQPDRIFLARSSGRSVTIGWTERGNIIFASEESALRWLEPLVRFTKFSKVAENRLLTIQNGKVVSRRTYAKPTAKQAFTPPPMEKRELSKFDEWMISNNIERANRRGELMFSGKSHKKNKGRVETSEIDEIVDITTGPLPEPSDSKLYYWDGELLSADEYRLAIEDRG